MKVLIAAGIYPPDPGGPAIHAKAQFDGFRERGIETMLVALSHLRHLPFGVRHIVYLYKLLIKGKGCDVIYAHDPLGVGLTALIATKLLGTVLVLRIGGDLLWERQAEEGKTYLSFLEWYKSGEHKKFIYFKLCRLVMENARAIIVPSPILADVYVEYYGIQREKITVIPNPLPDIDSKTEVRTSNTFIYASRLVGYKNLDFVLRVFARASKDFPDSKFAIMGSGQDRTKLEFLTKNLNLQDKVDFLGSVPQHEVLERTAQCRFAIAPALTEFNPLYILQCLAYKKPFLISREHGFSFEIPDEFVFDPRDEGELRKKMEAFLNKDSYKNLQEKARSIHFANSWDDVINRNLGIINSH